jgi:hypothetical protein
MPRCQSRKSDILCTHVRTRLQRDARKFLQTQNASRLMRLELSCARFILVKVSLHEKNSSGSSGGFGALRRTTGSCRGRLWNPVAIPIPCLDSFRPLRPRKPWQLRPAGSGSTPARIPFQRFIELLQGFSRKCFESARKGLFSGRIWAALSKAY